MTRNQLTFIVVGVALMFGGLALNAEFKRREAIGRADLLADSAAVYRLRADSVSAWSLTIQDSLKVVVGALREDSLQIAGQLLSSHRAASRARVRFDRMVERLTPPDTGALIGAAPLTTEQAEIFTAIVDTLEAETRACTLALQNCGQLLTASRQETEVIRSELGSEQSSHLVTQQAFDALRTAGPKTSVGEWGLRFVGMAAIVAHFFR